LACLPIILPLLLIGGGTVFKSGGANPSSWSDFIAFIGDKNVALGISAGIACVLWWISIRRNAKPSESGSGSGSVFDSGSMREKSQSALAGAGSILLITAAGGSFGAILQQTGIAQELGAWLRPGSGWTLPLAFGVTTLIRTAQGSATVAMLTVAGIFSGLADPQTLGFHPVYLALAIGVGSKPFAWMNDSGFWIIGKLSQMTEGETIKTFSIMTTLMALSGLVVICLAAWLFPLSGVYR
jgi:GntP family gluconate:H+ symporter